MAPKEIDERIAPTTSCGQGRVSNWWSQSIHIEGSYEGALSILSRANQPFNPCKNHLDNNIQTPLLQLQTDRKLAVALVPESVYETRPDEDA